MKYTGKINIPGMVASWILARKSILCHGSEIAILYSNGDTYADIAKKLNISLLICYPVKEETIRQSLIMVICGYNGKIAKHVKKFSRILSKPFKGLIETNERLKIAKSHMSTGGKKSSNSQKEIKDENGNILQNAKGIYSLSKEEITENSKLGVIACGKIIYSEQEKEFILKYGEIKSYANFANELNILFHNGKKVRNRKSIWRAVDRYRGKIAA